jgi:AAA domain
MKGAKEFKPSSPTEKNKRRPTLVQLSTVQSKEVDWLWFPYIPLGKLTLLEGDPSAGKTFLSLALCASITRGFPFLNQDGSPLRADETPCNVVYLTAEDGLDDTLKPRFDSMGGDATRFYALTGCNLKDESGNDHDMAVSLADVDVLREMLEQLHPKLVVIDPIQAYLGAGVDMHRANEVRPLLSGLSKLAEEYHTAVILIRHLGKSTKSKAMYSGLGSIDFAAAARSVLLAGEHNGQKLLAHVKSSLAPTGKSMSYSIGGESGFTWGGASDVTADELRLYEPETPNSEDEQSSIDEALEFLESQLTEGAMPGKDMFKQARQSGISQATLKRAKKELGVRSRRSSKGNEGDGTWLWYLEGYEHLADSSLSINNEPLAKHAENADRDATLATGSTHSLEPLARDPSLSSKNDDFARGSSTTLIENLAKNDTNDDLEVFDELAL